jgi:type I restriction-modification system DNA methylase subunit
MAIKKTELYSSLWAGCDELRGGMDASQYKDYVLTLLFMKYVSDKYKGDPYGMVVVPIGASFDDMVALKGDKEIGDKINKIISALAEENDLKGVIDVADFNDEDKLGKGKDMIDRLSKLIGIFEGLDLSANRADGDDLLPTDKKVQTAIASILPDTDTEIQILQQCLSKNHQIKQGKMQELLKGKTRLVKPVPEENANV